MSNNENTLHFYTIKKLLTKDNYVIPMYQRNYAWEEQEISQLIDDILDYQTKATKNDNYYIGTLVVYKQAVKEKSYEVIDGQQRLTTLSLLAIYLKHKLRESEEQWYQNYNLNLSFDCRDKSTYTLQGLFNNTILDNTNNLDKNRVKLTNPNILKGYEIITNTLESKINERDSTLKEFSDYISKNIKILRVEVPEHTDLNHYFEVMNNRGEQLEKHEVLKSHLLSMINEHSTNEDIHLISHTVNTVWEGISNMEKYIQSAFNPNLRTKIYGETWNQFKPSNFDELSHFFLEDIEEQKSKKDKKAQNKHETVEVNEDESVSIIKILSSGQRFTSQYNAGKDDNERFRSVINLPNFLLQVLRVYIHGIKGIAPIKNPDNKDSQTVSLDDKALIDEFEKHILKSNDINTVKEFIFYLLKSRFLFDKYIIKREYTNEGEGWELKKYVLKSNESAYFNNTFGKDEDDETGESLQTKFNQQIVMLLASFHVSIPSMSYKYWLNGSLNWLISYANEDDISAEDYLTHLTGMAESFLFDRYLSYEQLDYYEIVFVNQCEPQDKPNDINDVNTDLLTYDHIKNNFVFNYLDYLIWRAEYKNKKVYTNFEFTFRSSVEHFYSQTAVGYEDMGEDDRDSFGNLFLITHSQNSSFSNKPPLEKLGFIIGNYLKDGNLDGKTPSLKLIKLTEKLRGQWKSGDQRAEQYAKLLKEHEQEMLQLYVAE